MIIYAYDFDDSLNRCCGFDACVCDYLDSLDHDPALSSSACEAYLRRPWPHLTTPESPCPCFRCESMRRQSTRATGDRARQTEPEGHPAHLVAAILRADPMTQ